jgi:hypothetical protein
MRRAMLENPPDDLGVLDAYAITSSFPAQR